MLPEPEADEPVVDHGHYSDVDPEIMFHLMAAERLIGVGDYLGALEQYLDAAEMSHNPEFARQASRIAAQLGQWESALIGTGRWLELDPDSEDAEQIRLLAWLNTGQVEQALDALLNLLARHDDSREGWRRAAMLISASEDDELAIDVMSRLVDRSGTNGADPEILHIQSVLLWQLGDADRALVLALDAAERSAERKHKLWAAQLAAGVENLDLALEIYRSARLAEPDYVPLALAEAEVLRQLDRTDDAVRLLREMPADSEVLYTLGIYLARSERIEEAEDALHKLASITGVEDQTHHAFLVAQLAGLLEQDQMALHWYEKVDSGPNKHRALLRSAVILGQGGDLIEARKLLEAVRLTDDAVLREEAWLVEAELLREAGRAAEAVELLTVALRESPNSIRLLYSRGLNAVHADNLELAEQDFRRIIQIDDENAMALNALGYTLTDRTDRHQEAYRLIRRALELNPDDPPTLDSMGWVYFRLGQPEKALPYLERALEAEANPEIAAHVIEVLWTLDRLTEAMELRDRAIVEWPDDDYLVETLERLGLDQ